MLLNISVDFWPKNEHFDSEKQICNMELRKIASAKQEGHEVLEVLTWIIQQD